MEEENSTANMDGMVMTCIHLAFFCHQSFAVNEDTLDWKEHALYHWITLLWFA
jgi:hypothetical protein